jgi:hypothetical protein
MRKLQTMKDLKHYLMVQVYLARIQPEYKKIMANLLLLMFLYLLYL